MNSVSDFASNYREAHCLLSQWWGGEWLVMYASTSHLIPLTPILTLLHTHTHTHIYIYVYVSGMVSSLQASQAEQCMHFLFLPCKLHVLPISKSAQLQGGVSQLFGCLQCICFYPLHLENALLLSNMRMYNVLFTRHSLSSYAALNYLWCGYSILK
jgi:hypothetical protein